MLFPQVCFSWVSMFSCWPCLTLQPYSGFFQKDWATTILLITSRVDRPCLDNFGKTVQREKAVFRCGPLCGRVNISLIPECTSFLAKLYVLKQFEMLPNGCVSGRLCVMHVLSPSMLIGLQGSRQHMFFLLPFSSMSVFFYSAGWQKTCKWRRMATNFPHIKWLLLWMKISKGGPWLLSHQNQRPIWCVIRQRLTIRPAT